MASIAHIITGMSIGGAEKVILELARHVKGHTQYFFLLDDNKNELLPEAQEADISFTPLKLRKNPLSFLRAVRELLAHIKQHNITILHAHMFHPLLIACAAKICKPSLKIVYTYHLSGAKFHLRQHIMFWLKPLRNVDVVFTPQTAYYHRKGDRQAVIANGIDTARFDASRAKRPAFTFITVGRLERVKNHLALIHAFASFKNKPVELLIVGQGHLEPQLIDAIKANGLGSQIHLLGARHDIPELLCSSHVFVLPSIEEGLPIALLEAGAAGLPVITTDVGSINTLISEDNGWLTAIDEFPRVMQYLVDHYEACLPKAKRLQTHIQSDYSSEAMARQHGELYNRVASL